MQWTIFSKSQIKGMTSRFLFCGFVACREDGYWSAITTTSHLSTASHLSTLSRLFGPSHLSADVALSMVLYETVPSLGVAYFEGQILLLY